MKIYLASGNINKKYEVQELLPAHKIVLPKEENIEFDPEENGSSFFENAMIKAKALYDIVKTPVLADDSGLCIDSLNGAPGIHSARYGAVNGEHVSAEAGINKVLLQLKKEKNRRAHFACCMIFLLSEDRFYAVQETCEGYITEEPAGSGGFGYDPIFFMKEFGKTFAELSSDQKNSVSHRGRALAAIKKIIEKI